MSEVQRRPDHLVAGDRVVDLGQADDARRDQRHGRVAEVAEQRLQPTAPRNHVGVQEGHEVGADGGQTGVARRGRTPADRVPQHLQVTGCVGEVLARIGTAEPSSTTTTRMPRNVDASRLTPDRLSRTGITMVTSRCDGPPAGRGCATVASSSVRASWALCASRTSSRPRRSMVWAAGASRSSRVGEPPSRAAPSPSTRTRRSTCTANPSGSRGLAHRSIPSAPGVHRSIRSTAPGPSRRTGAHRRRRSPWSGPPALPPHSLPPLPRGACSASDLPAARDSPAGISVNQHITR